MIITEHRDLNIITAKLDAQTRLMAWKTPDGEPRIEITKELADDSTIEIAVTFNHYQLRNLLDTLSNWHAFTQWHLTNSA